MDGLWRKLKLQGYSVEEYRIINLYLALCLEFDYLIKCRCTDMRLCIRCDLESQAKRYGTIHKKIITKEKIYAAMKTYRINLSHDVVDNILLNHISDH